VIAACNQIPAFLIAASNQHAKNASVIAVCNQIQAFLIALCNQLAQAP
jgi:hypothetical protein